MRNIKSSMSLVKKAAALMLALVTLVLCACSNMMNNSEGEQGAEVSKPTASAVVEKQQGGDLFIAMPAGVESLNPLTATDEDLVNLLGLIYEPAVRVGEDGQPQPCLVESWETDESGTIFTFHVRQDVTFSDGTPLTANDILYSAQQVAALSGTEFGAPQAPDPAGSQNPEATQSAEATQSPEASGSSSESPTVEIPQTNHYVQYNSLVSNIEVVDDQTVRVTMTKPGLEALYFMAFPVMNEGLRAQDNTIGTGPYRIESFDPSSEMVLAANESWWGQTPNIPQIVAKPMTGSSAKLDAVSTSVLDLITTDVLYAGKYKSAGKTQVVDYMTNYYDCLVPNLANSALGVAEVRQALSYAIDRRELISTVLLNHGVPANMPISPDFYAFDSKYKQDDDLNTARSLLKAAGYKSGLEDGEGMQLQLTLIVPDDREKSYRVEAAKAIAKQFEEVGVILNIEPLNQQDYYTRLQNRDFELALCSFYMDADPNIGFMFNPGGSANYGGVDNQELTAAITAARAAFTEDGIKNAYSELQRQLTERVPQIGLYYRTNSIVCNELLKGIEIPIQGQIFAQVNEWYYQKS